MGLAWGGGGRQRQKAWSCTLKTGADWLTDFSQPDPTKICLCDVSCGAYVLTVLSVSTHSEWVLNYAWMRARTRNAVPDLHFQISQHSERANYHSDTGQLHDLTFCVHPTSGQPSAIASLNFWLTVSAHCFMEYGYLCLRKAHWFLNGNKWGRQITCVHTVDAAVSGPVSNTAKLSRQQASWSTLSIKGDPSEETSQAPSSGIVITIIIKKKKKKARKTHSGIFSRFTILFVQNRP